MATYPAPLPPPPPPPIFPKGNKGFPENGELSGEKVSELGKTETKEVSEEEFIAQVCDLQSRLPPQILNSDGTETGVSLVVAVPLQRAILQNGPMCGIVALAEGLQLLNKQDEEVDQTSPKTLIDAAILEGLTKQGEMFSVADMKALAQKFGACTHSEIIDLNGQEENDDIGDRKVFMKAVSNLLKGFPILFPYDADYNHSPTLRKGHAAHWAVIHGIACHIPQSKSRLFLDQTNAFQPLKCTKELIIIRPIYKPCCDSSNQTDLNTNVLVDELAALFNYETSYAVAHQGKSYRTAMWKFADLFESNKNLKEVAPKIITNPSNYIFGNIVEGLCSKVLLLKL